MLMSGCYFISLENLARNLEGNDVTGDETASVYGIDVSHLSSNIEGAIQNILHRSTCPLFEKSNDTSVFEMWSVSESDHKVPSGDLDDKQLKSKKKKIFQIPTYRSSEGIAKNVTLQQSKNSEPEKPNYSEINY